jgi:hypothetical protein
MIFPNQRNEYKVLNVSGLLTLAQCQLGFPQQHWNSVWRLRNFFRNLKLVPVQLKLVSAPGILVLPSVSANKPAGPTVKIMQ